MLTILTTILALSSILPGAVFAAPTPSALSRRQGASGTYGTDGSYSTTEYEWIFVGPTEYSTYNSVSTYTSGSTPYTLVSTDYPGYSGNKIFTCAVLFEDSTWSIGWFDPTITFACVAVHNGVEVIVDGSSQYSTCKSYFLTIETGYTASWISYSDLSSSYCPVYAPDQITEVAEVCLPLTGTYSSSSSSYPGGSSYSGSSSSGHHIVRKNARA
ncbi:hypothetical protein BDK51DRAFT_44955 [Blyttiomyces helicus]|uniref:Ig-like domain-containing protein n=1 Tax=Blyttiomyces helicus TaxID=388810 RepID=A0A4P9WFP3_9FUNG|nr:hypothetical protein BDK51DRAFT_44955 [Blyttiomyces helicus]|eukprot:RKO90685.1 hypothetical protein BDK51DRAFT_44955 [Blyttiomyces helicus]